MVANFKNLPKTSVQKIIMFPKYPGKAIVYLTLAITTLLFLLSKSSLHSLGTNIFVSIAQLTALLGTVLFAFSFILAARTYLIEEAFGGLDRAYRVHHKTGVWSFGLLAAHFISVLIGYGINKLPVATLMFNGRAFIVGEIALAVMAIIILTIIFAKVKYQYFVIIQKFFAIPFAFGIFHLLIVGSDISRYAPLKLFMIVIVYLGALSWVYREFFYKTIGPSAEYTIDKVTNKGGDIFELSLSPVGKPLVPTFGQFAYFSFHSKNVPAEMHPFSFSSVSTDGKTSFAAKALGDFTKILNRAETGDRVTVYGPYGKFFADFDREENNIFIAGGIGITPFLSVLRGNNSCRNTQIFYTTKNEKDCVFLEELNKLSCDNTAFNCFFHDSERRGHLTADIVEKRAGGLDGKKIFLCGPGPMMKSITAGLIAKGIPKENIIFEAFSY